MPAFLASFRLEPYLWEEGGGSIRQERRENVRKEDSKRHSGEGERASQQSRKQTMRRVTYTARERETERVRQRERARTSERASGWGRSTTKNTNETMREGAYQAEIVCARKSQRQTQAMEKER